MSEEQGSFKDNWTEVGAIWKKSEDKWSIKVSQTVKEGTNLLVLKNSFKESDNQPDFRVFRKNGEE